MNRYYVEYLDYEDEECGMTVMAADIEEARKKAMLIYNVCEVISVKAY